MIDFKMVGARIAEHRRRMGLSQEELASMLYVTRQAVSKWEQGASVPSIDLLSGLSELFSVSFEELLGLFAPTPEITDKNDVFKGHDRGYIINKIAKGEIKIPLQEVLYQMSPNERMYLLSYVKQGELDTDYNELMPYLAFHEKKYLGLLLE